VQWTWDARKDAANRIKHGLPLDIAALVVADPLAVSLLDPHADGDRWRTVGRVAGRVLVAVHTWPEDEVDGVARSISVRKATPGERREYENG